ncbi:MAG: hypothetical protein Q7J12_02445 [Syntrophales bacterium]|nr:hypothetical protein [Syntrophales bacterium]
MNELEKLKVLLQHWMEHNTEHADNYKVWAGKASSLGNEELSKTLLRLYEETRKLNELFEEAQRKISQG